MTEKAKIAVELFNKKLHCSQSILAAYADECGISYEQAIKLGSCFGSGMRKGEVCGACTGALMVLGLLYGQHDETDAEGRARSNTLNDQMMEKFSKKCGSYLCNEILGCDIKTKEGVEYARSHKLFTELCPKIVEQAAIALEEMIAENENS